MRKPLIGVLLALTSLGSVAQDGTMKADGRMWASYGNASSQGMLIKAAYVQGAMEGLSVGATMGYLSGRADVKNDAADWHEVTAGADKVRAKFGPQNTSVLDIVRQMDKFYGDYRNTPVCMIVAVQESVSSRRGTASSEQGLEMARKGCNQ